MYRYCGFAFLLVLFSACSNPTYTTKQLLEQDKKSEQQAVNTSSVKEAVKQTMDRFTQVFSRYQKDEIKSAVPMLYAKDAFLNDRIHSIQGIEAISQYFEGTFEKIEEANFVVYQHTMGEKESYLRWNMRLRLKKEEEFMEFFGVSLFRFNQEGKIIYHQDFWDFSELLAKLPITSALVHYAKQKA